MDLWDAYYQFFTQFHQSCVFFHPKLSRLNFASSKNKNERMIQTSLESPFRFDLLLKPLRRVVLTFGPRGQNWFQTDLLETKMKKSDHKYNIFWN